MVSKVSIDALAFARDWIMEFEGQGDPVNSEHQKTMIAYLEAEIAKRKARQDARREERFANTVAEELAEQQGLTAAEVRRNPRFVSVLAKVKAARDGKP